jgi:predicted acyl esterase
VLQANSAQSPSPADKRLIGDWDYYVMLGAAPNGGFEARRRMGFAHFDGPYANGAWFKRRSGAPLYTITKLTITGDNVTVSLENGSEILAVLKGEGIEGRLYRGGKPIDRIWLVKRTEPPSWEPNYALWPDDSSSRPTFQVTVDPAVPMTARDGTTLMNYVARPVGAGPFAVVLERTPYLRIDKANGEFWASRGYIYVKQDVRGRGGSGGILDMNAKQDVERRLHIHAVIGDNTWRKEREWPLARTVWTNFYLRQNGKLETTAPGTEPPDEYTYDPGNPTPLLVNSRELELSLNEDYRTVDTERKDLVTYTTAPLDKDTEITGPMTATLWAVTEGKDTDWNVMLQHVYPDGRAERIQDGVMRARFRDGFDRPSLLKPGKIYKYDIDLWFTSRVIPAGHRLRVTVASAAFPKYDRNLNTGGDNERDTRYIVVRQRILHDKAHPSFVRLPIIPR